MAVGIIVKNYNHVNKAFANWDTPDGKLVKSKDHYDRLVKEGGYVSYEESVEKSKNNGNKPFVPTEKALAIIKAAKMTKDSKGNVKLSDRTIDAMKEIGAIGKTIPAYMKNSDKKTSEGGFYTNKKEYAQGFSL